jgi:anti-anti-sigma factor
MSTIQTHDPTSTDTIGVPILSVDLIRQGAAAVITLRGELDISTANLVTSTMHRAALKHPSRVTIDLAGVTFFSAAGITALLRARNTAKAAGAQLVLRRPSAQVQRVLVITKTDHLFLFKTSHRVA